MKNLFITFSNAVAKWSGKPIAFVLALLFIIVWAVTGPMFDYSETWQLVVNTATTIITFLMVFVLQNSQNRDGKALQAKLDDLIWSSQAENSFIGAENLDEAELLAMSRKLTENAAKLKAHAGKAATKHQTKHPVKKSRSK